MPYQIKMNYINRFSGKSEIYSKARPKYAEGLFQHLKDMPEINQQSIFADIGSGTGIFTRQLLDCGYKVYAVEPNDDMRKKAEEELFQNKNFVSVNGSADSTGLNENSVDFITAAQSFHWFEPELFKKECRRILKPDGKVIIVYNFRNENAACNKALAQLQHKYNSDFRGFSSGMNEEKCIAFFGGNCSIYRTDNTQYYDAQGYIDRIMSSSYSPNKGSEVFNEYLKEVIEIFNKFSYEDQIAIPTDTVAYIGNVYE